MIGEYLALALLVMFSAIIGSVIGTLLVYLYLPTLMWYGGW
jgi:hypothetical protein